MKKNIFKVIACALAVTITLASTGTVAFADEPGAEDSGVSSNGGFNFGNFWDMASFGTEESVAEETTVEETVVVEEPVTTEPVTTEPVTTEPVTTEPAATEPVTTEPAATEPVTTEPAATEPVTTEPVATEPVATEPAATKPATTKPAATVKPVVKAVALEVTVNTPVQTRSVETHSVKVRSPKVSNAQTYAVRTSSKGSFNLGDFWTIGSFNFGSFWDMMEKASKPKEPEYVTVSTYYCNCSACYHTTDYNALKMHMFQHVLKGERNSYSTHVEKILK